MTPLPFLRIRYLGGCHRAGHAHPITVDLPNKKVLRFDFDIIHLGGMDAEASVHMPNPAALALSARMRFPKERRIAIIRDFAITLARLKLKPAIADMVAAFFFAYQKLSQEEGLQLRRQLGRVESTEMKKEILPLINPWTEAGKREGLKRGLQRGLKRGRHEGEALLVLKQLRRRLGVVSATQEGVIRRLTLRKVEALGEALLQFECRADLTVWLRQNK